MFVSRRLDPPPPALKTTNCVQSGVWCILECFLSWILLPPVVPHGFDVFFSRGAARARPGARGGEGVLQWGADGENSTHQTKKLH